MNRRGFLGLLAIAAAARLPSFAWSRTPKIVSVDVGTTYLNYDGAMYVFDGEKWLLVARGS